MTQADGNYRYFYKSVANPSLVLPIMACTGRLLSKRVPFSGFMYVKMWTFY